MSEIRTVSSLALLYAFRMLGLFMVLPVLMAYGGSYRDASPAALGLALGIYGLTQAVFQIPLGLLSDRIGRKPVIIVGLSVFALGSVVAATATTVEGLIIGRALQGSGAIASTIMAMVADLTSEQNRTKAMAAIGASIGLSFSIAMMLGPMVAAFSGIAGVFWLAAGLAVIGVIVLTSLVPTPRKMSAGRDIKVDRATILATLRNAQLNRLNLGIFSLHCILMTMFVSLPGVLIDTLQLQREHHWQFYLPVLALAFLTMLPLMIAAEKKRKTRPVFLSAVCFIAISAAGLGFMSHSMWAVLGCVFLFFIAFNLLEAMLPSLVSKLAPPGTKGGAMGIYSSCQFVGAFLGGVLGGWLLEHYSSAAVFGFSAAIAVLWVVFAWPMRAPPHVSSISLQVLGQKQAHALAGLPGVVDVFHAEEESTVYLKIDRDVVSEAEVREIARGCAI